MWCPDVVGKKREFRKQFLSLGFVERMASVDLRQVPWPLGTQVLDEANKTSLPGLGGSSRTDAGLFHRTSAVGVLLKCPEQENRVGQCSRDA